VREGGQEFASEGHHSLRIHVDVGKPKFLECLPSRLHATVHDIPDVLDEPFILKPSERTLRRAIPPPHPVCLGAIGTVVAVPAQTSRWSVSGSVG
jgi:hypothetical protein